MNIDRVLLILTIVLVTLLVCLVLFSRDEMRTLESEREKWADSEVGLR